MKIVTLNLAVTDQPLADNTSKDNNKNTILELDIVTLNICYYAVMLV